jgi:membrane protein
VSHVVKSASATNSVFALVLGVLAFFYLTSVVILLCAEVNVVLTDHLYPRALLAPFTDATALTASDPKPTPDRPERSASQTPRHRRPLRDQASRRHPLTALPLTARR